MSNIFINDNGLSTDIYSKLFEDRIIFLNKEVNEDSATLIKAQLLYLDQISHEPIKMYIDSPGGDVYTGMGIIDTMEFITSKVETINIGLAASMAAIILCCGDIRKSLKHSRILLHQPLGGIYGQADDIEITAVEIKKIKTILYKTLSKKTGKSIDQIEIDANRDYWLDAKKAKKYGLIDEVIKKEMKI